MISRIRYAKHRLSHLVRGKVYVEEKTMKTKFKSLLTLFIALIGLTFSSQIGVAASFDGPYVGVRAGVGIIKQQGSILSGPFEQKTTSAMVGGILGFRTNLENINNLVLGVETDINYYTNGNDWRYGVSAIAGYRFTDTSMIYLKGGYGKLANTGDDLEGALFGAGIEFAIREAINLRLEYKNLRYGEVNFSDNMVRSNGNEISSALIFSF